MLLPMPSTYQQRKESKARKLAKAEAERKLAARQSRDEKLAQGITTGLVSSPAPVDPDFPDEMGAVTSDDPALTTMPPRSVTTMPARGLRAEVFTDHDGVPRAEVTADVATNDPALLVDPAKPVWDAAMSVSGTKAFHGVVSPAAAFASWLDSPQGLDCTDPRAPLDPLRRRADMETRLKLAFIAGMGAASGREDWKGVGL